MAQLFTNNGSARLISDVQPGDTTVTLAPGEGDRFPLPDAGDSESYALLTLEDVNANFEIVKMDSRNGDILTIERGQEDTAPAGFATGSRIECRLTDGSLSNFVQQGDKWLLRGGDIDSDGVKYWHQTDPSSYQYFYYRYTNTIFGVPAMLIQSPAGLPGMSWAVGIIGPDGTRRYAWLSGGLSANANPPVTNQVVFSVPGVLSLEQIEGGLGTRRIHNSYAFNEDEANGTKCRWHSTGNGTNVYSFTTQDADNKEWAVQFGGKGQIHCNNYLRLNNPDISQYTDAQGVNFLHQANPYDPINGDWTTFYGVNRENVARAHDFAFVTREKVEAEGENPASGLEKVIAMTKGKVQSAEAPTDPTDLCNKEYVDTAITTGVGTTVDQLAEQIFGRTVLYNSATGIGNGQTANLDTGAFSEYFDLEVLGHTTGGGGNWATLRVSTGTLIDELGYNNEIIVMTKLGGGDNATLTWRAITDTSFGVSAQGDAGDISTYKVKKIVGLNPKEITTPEEENTRVGKQLNYDPSISTTSAESSIFRRMMNGQYFTQVVWRDGSSGRGAAS